MHPILPRELRNGELFLVPLTTVDTFNATAMSVAIQAEIASKHLMFVTFNVPVMNVAIQDKSAYRRSRSRRTACLSGTWQTRLGAHDETFGTTRKNTEVVYDDEVQSKRFTLKLTYCLVTDWAQIMFEPFNVPAKHDWHRCIFVNDSAWRSRLRSLVADHAQDLPRAHQAKTVRANRDPCHTLCWRRSSSHS